MERLAPPPKPFATCIRVRYQDTDAAGVVYYANHLAYFEVARVELLRAVGMPIGDVQARGIVLPVVEAQCRYRRPVLLDDLIEVRLWLTSAGRAQFAFAYEIWRGEELLATGRTRHAVVDQATGRAVPVPGWLAALFERTRAMEQTA